MIGIGIDIVSMHRVSSLLSKHGHKFVRRIVPALSSMEVSVESLAGRWALREAAFKAARIPFSKIVVEPSYPPTIGKVDGVQFMTSLSHDAEVAVAVAIAFAV